jgi:hypothetical protein
VHLCAHKPCQAMWPASKYTEFGPPMHLQLIPTAVAEPPSAPPSMEPPLPPPPSPPPMESAVAAPAPMEHPSPPPMDDPSQPPMEPPSQPPMEPPQPPPEVPLSPPPAPAVPIRAPLKTLRPPAPVIPSDEDVVATAHAESAVAAPAPAESAVAVLAPAKSAAEIPAQEKIAARLLALAREIRTPRKYVGYSAFILMGLLKEVRPCAWEGGTFIDLLETFAPWAVERCQCTTFAIPCASDKRADGPRAFVQVSDRYPLSRCIHYLAGVAAPALAFAEPPIGIEAFYASLGVVVSATVVDGDCGLDVMQRMLSQPGSYEGRVQLRREISDYLLERIGESWMHDLMLACQELQEEDLEALRRSADIKVAPPTAPAAAVALGKPAELMERAMPDEETFAAMRWATRLPHDAAVLGLIRSLPQAVVEEQIRLYRQHQREGVAAVAEKKILVSKALPLSERRLIAKRFDAYCQRSGVAAKDRMPYGTMRTFIDHHLDCSARGGHFSIAAHSKVASQMAGRDLGRQRRCRERAEESS